MKYISIIISTWYYLFKCEKWINPPTNAFVGRILVLFMHSWEVKQTQLLPAGGLLSLLSHFCLTTLPGGHPGPSFPSPSSHSLWGSQNIQSFWDFTNWSVGSYLLTWVSSYLPCKLFICESWTHFPSYSREKMMGDAFETQARLLCDFIWPLIRHVLWHLYPGPV